MGIDWPDKSEQIRRILAAESRNSVELVSLGEELRRECYALRNMSDLNTCDFVTAMEDGLGTLTGSEALVAWNAHALITLLVNEMLELIKRGEGKGHFVVEDDFECLARLLELAAAEPICVGHSWAISLRASIRGVVESIVAGRKHSSVSDGALKRAWQLLADSAVDMSEKASLVAISREVLAAGQEWMDEEIKNTLLGWVAQAVEEG